MKRNLFIKLARGTLGVLLASSCVFSARAQGYINGDISFVGGATLDAALGSATKFTSIFGPGGVGLPQVLGGSQTGNYAGVSAGTQATFPLFTFIPSPGSSFPLWSFTFGGNSYSFQADSITFVYQNSMFLDIAGTGTASITGFADTTGTWSIVDTGQSSSPVFTFGAATQVNGPPVPEPSVFALLASFIPVFAAFRCRNRA